MRIKGFTSGQTSVEGQLGGHITWIQIRFKFKGSFTYLQKKIIITPQIFKSTLPVKMAEIIENVEISYGKYREKSKILKSEKLKKNLFS